MVIQPKVPESDIDILRRACTAVCAALDRAKARDEDDGFVVQALLSGCAATLALIIANSEEEGA